MSPPLNKIVLLIYYSKNINIYMFTTIISTIATIGFILLEGWNKNENVRRYGNSL